MDGRDFWYMPGLVDTHTHIGQQLLKGKVLDARPIIWTRIMLPFESTLDAETMRLNAELCALEMIQSGTVGFVDAGSYFMEEALDVMQQSGLVGSMTTSTMDDPALPESIRMSAEEAIAATTRLWEKTENDRIRVNYSLRALNNCSDELIVRAFEEAKKHNTKVVAHMNEYAMEVKGIVTRSGKTPYVFLNDLVELNENFLGAHSLVLTDEEKEIIEKHHISICHCPFSNSGKAIPDTPELLERGINIGLGTDGAAHGGLSLWNEMKIFRCLMNIFHGVPTNNYAVMPATQLLTMATVNGNRILGENAGEIRMGQKANLIGIKANSASLLPTGNIVNTLLECVNAPDVDTMIVRGKVLMQNREVKTLDQEAILAKAKEKGWITE